MASFPTRSQEGGIEGYEMNCGWVSTSDLDLPVDHETHAEKVDTEQLTTGPRCASPCLKTLEAVPIYRVQRQKTLYWVGPCSTRTLRLSNIWLGVHSSSLELVLRGRDFWNMISLCVSTRYLRIYYLDLSSICNVHCASRNRETRRRVAPITTLMGFTIQGGRVRRADAWYAVRFTFLAALAFGK